MVFLSNYERSSFSNFFSIQWFNHWLYLDRKEKRVIDDNHWLYLDRKEKRVIDDNHWLYLDRKEKRVIDYNDWLYLDRKEKRVIDAIKTVKQSYMFSKSLFICNFFFDWEQPALEVFIKLNYCVPVEFTVFQNASCIHRKTISCYQVAVVALFWVQERKLQMQNTLLESVKCCYPWIKIDRVRTMMF